VNHELVRIFIDEILPNFWHIYKGYIILLSCLFIVKKGLISFYSRRRKREAMANFVIGINNLYFVFLVFVLFFLILRFFGITIHEFFTSIAIVAAALAIVFRDYILNGLNGMLFILGDNISVGDYVKIDKHKGVVKNISLVAVHLMNDEQDLVMLPNNFVMGCEIINFTKNPHHSFSIEFTLPIAKASTINELEDYLLRAINDEEVYIRPNEHSLILHGITEKSISYTLQYNLMLNTASNQNIVRQRCWNAIIKQVQH
jgi:small-conductance mechanosensitive channel